VKRVLALVATVGLVVGWWVVVPRYGLRSFRVPTASMHPTVPVGARVLVRSTQAVHAGDIVVLRAAGNGSMQIKRLVADGGSVVEIRDKRLFVNGREVDEPYAKHDDPNLYPRNPALPEPYRSRDQFGPYRVPDNAFFALGDNRDQTYDSRYWGALPRENVIGRVVLVVTATGIRRPR
jgi:signal peptidase I